MKNLLLVVVLFVSTALLAQKKYASYQAESSNYDLSVVVDGDSKGAVYMDIKDDGDSSVGFKDAVSRADFITFLSQSKAKFIEWKATALENNVEDVTKEIKTARVGSSIAFHYGSWHFSFGKHDVTSYFRVFKSVPYFLLRYPEVKSSDNEYIDQKAQTVVFRDVSEIDALAKALSNEAVDEFIAKTNKAKDLFN